VEAVVLAVAITLAVEVSVPLEDPVLDMVAEGVDVGDSVLELEAVGVRVEDEDELLLSDAGIVAVAVSEEDRLVDQLALVLTEPDTEAEAEGGAV